MWSYWSGPQPDWIGWCLDSIKRCCKKSTFHLITPGNADEFAPDSILNPRWRTIEPGIATDCLRAALLAEHGGVWIDADTVCLCDPIKLVETYSPSQAVYTTWPSKPDRVVAGYFYAPKGHRVAREWLTSINAALENSENIGWMDLGERMLTPIIRRSPSPEETWEMARETFLPLNVADDPERMFKESGWRDFTTPQTIGFGLNHSWMMKNHYLEMTMTAEGMRNTGVMIHRLLMDNRA